MPDVELSHAQGSPCWADLMTPDQPAALDFYRPLLGWTGEPGGPEVGGYAVLALEGRPVAGIGPQMPGQPPTSPQWTTYFAVRDIKATAARITEHGGNLFMPPAKVPNAGWMALALDPAGAVFGIWQPEPFDGFRTGQEPGAPVWFELTTTQGKMSAAFYSTVFEVEVPPMEQMPDEYWLVTVGGKQVAGIWDSATSGAGAAARWQPYFQVADTDMTVDAAVAAGATVVGEAKDSPYGRLAVLADPQGARFSVIGRPAN